MKSDVDIFDSATVVWSKRYILLLLFFAAGISGYIGSFFLDETFESNVALVATNQTQTGGLLGGLADQFGGLFGSVNLQDDVAKNLAILTTRSLLLEFADRYSIRQELFKERWNEADQSWQAPSGISGWWFRLVKGDQVSMPPSDEDTLEVLRDNLIVAENKQNGVITVSLFWTTRDHPPLWLNGLIDMLNQRISEVQIYMKILRAAQLRQRRTRPRRTRYRVRRRIPRMRLL